MGIWSDTALATMLKSRLTYVNQRERLISENIANADTPGYRPRDMKTYDFEAMLKRGGGASGLERTSAMHLSGKGGEGTFQDETVPDSETRLDGNQVVLEEQMNKMTEARIDAEAAIDFYQQVQTMISTAAKAPGKSS